MFCVSELFFLEFSRRQDFYFELAIQFGILFFSSSSSSFASALVVIKVSVAKLANHNISWFTFFGFVNLATTKFYALANFSTHFAFLSLSPPLSFDSMGLCAMKKNVYTCKNSNTLHPMLSYLFHWRAFVLGVVVFFCIWRSFGLGFRVLTLSRK